jgi:hypothetical protein
MLPGPHGEPVVAEKLRAAAAQSTRVPVAPERVLVRQADGQLGDAADCRRAAGAAPLAGVVFSGGKPAVSGQ